MRGVATANEFTHGLLGRFVGRGDGVEEPTPFILYFDCSSEVGLNGRGSSFRQLLGEIQVLSELVGSEWHRVHQYTK
ncbi:hypothetical protein D3C76_462020 [compost metagenome]